MHSRPYRGPQSEIIRREPLFLIRGSGEAHFRATRLAHVKRGTARGFRVTRLVDKMRPGTLIVAFSGAKNNAIFACEYREPSVGDDSRCIGRLSSREKWVNNERGYIFET